MIASHGVEQNVHLTGLVPYEELPWYLGCADLFVLPFPNEIYNVGRWPNKMGDYMSLGRPTISNTVGDIKILFEEHSVGLLAECNPVDFAEKIIFLLSHPDTARQLGKTARKVAVSLYDWKVIAGRLEAFLYKVLELERCAGLSTAVDSASL
jgi:glycosyltransferase involved in cell wall biosynthesis